MLTNIYKHLEYWVSFEAFETSEHAPVKNKDIKRQIMKRKKKVPRKQLLQTRLNAHETKQLEILSEMFMLLKKSSVIQCSFNSVNLKELLT